MLRNFALYCALDEALHKQDRKLWTWRQWPEQYHSPDTEAAKRFAAEHPRLLPFYQYIQFVIDEQLAAAQADMRQSGLSIGLYHDLALATDSCGADLWAYRDFYINGCRVGAPPDDFSPNGQDWAFPPPNADAHYANGYRMYRESIRKVVQHGGALRIDHVMRLFRLFWIPEGASAQQGTYVRDRATDLMRILALESVRAQNIVIGEDLGTVTDEIREMLARFGILSYRLFYFEKHRDETFKGSRRVSASGSRRVQHTRSCNHVRILARPRHRGTPPSRPGGRPRRVAATRTSPARKAADAQHPARRTPASRWLRRETRARFRKWTAYCTPQSIAFWRGFPPCCCCSIRKT